MPFALHPHPEAPSDAIESIDVEVSWTTAPGRRARQLLLRYVVIGDLGEVRIPPRVQPARADELWRHTCFEVFLRFGRADEYREFNFSPSGRWAAYDFDSYRTGMRPAELAEPPLIEAETRGSQLAVQVALQPNEEERTDVVTRVALCAVIEGADGRVSYWAAAHPSAKPDFHHPDGFVLELAP